MQIFKHDGKEYIELPKTDDGEYIHVGTALYDERGNERQVAGVNAALKGGWTVNLDKGYSIHSSQLKDFTANPPQPEVLDADGVPIKAGDTVYDIHEGMAYTVRELIGEKFGSQWFYTEEGIAPCLAWYFTHKEPDTQEKIDADATLSPITYCEKYLKSEWGSWDMSEMITHMNQHLLNRQREVCKREKGGE